MKYVQPYGITDPDAPYINGNPSLGIQGSIPPAAAFEEPMREIVTVIGKSGITPDDGDLQQMAKGIRSQAMNFATDSGTADNLIVVYDPPLLAYTAGLILRVKVAVSNDGSATIDAGAGRALIKKTNGLPVAAGDLPAGGVVSLVFDGTAFQLVNSSVTGTGGTPPAVTFAALPYCVDDSATPNVIDAHFSPAITTMPAGTAFLVKIANTNTGPTTINVNANTNIPVKANGHGALGPGDVVVGDVHLFVYDGTVLWIDASARQAGRLHGRCHLALVSGSLVLAPYNGSGIVIGGVLYPLPAAGVSLSSAGLSANTFYYIYAQAPSGVSGPVVQLTAFTTGHATDANGIEVMSGSPMNTLVGAAMTNALGQFVDQDGQRLVLSWFNRMIKRSVTAMVSPTTVFTSGGAFHEPSTVFRNNFISWLDEDIQAEFFGMGGGLGLTIFGLGVAYDGAAVPESPWDVYESEYAGGNYAWSYHHLSHKRGLSENIMHVATMLCGVSAGTLQLNYGGSLFGAPVSVNLTLSYRG
jgi:hypothetical protein